MVPAPTLEMEIDAENNYGQKRRRATSSESIKFDRPANSAEPETNEDLTTGQVSTLNNESSDFRNLANDNSTFSNEEEDALPSDLEAVRQFNSGGTAAPVANMAGSGLGETVAVHEGSSRALSVERSPDSELSPMDIDFNDKSTVSSNNWAKFKKLSKQLTDHERQTSVILLNMNEEHHNAIERGRKVAQRRMRRIEELERENVALKTKLSSSAANATTVETWESKYNMSQQALQMLTDDCNTWENKCSQLQRELNETVVQNSTADRDSRFTQEQVESMTRRVEECQEELKEATRKARESQTQASQLEELLGKTDAAVIQRVRNLAKARAVWKESGNDRLKKKVFDQASALVDAWNKFEGEFDAAMGEVH